MPPLERTGMDMIEEKSCPGCGGPMPVYIGNGRPRKYCKPKCEKRAAMRRVRAKQAARHPYDVEREEMVRNIGNRIAALEAKRAGVMPPGHLIDCDGRGSNVQCCDGTFDAVPWLSQPAELGRSEQAELEQKRAFLDKLKNIGNPDHVTFTAVEPVERVEPRCKHCGEPITRSRAKFFLYACEPCQELEQDGRIPWKPITG
jgi:hypothetical protein